MKEKSKLIISLIILFPFAIGIALRILDLIGIVEIKSSDWNTYLVALVPLIGTSILGAVSFWQTQKANETSKHALTLSTNESQRQVLPYFSFRHMQQTRIPHPIVSCIIAQDEKENSNSKAFIEVKPPEFEIVKDIFFTINALNDEGDDDIRVTSALSKEQQYLIDASGFHVTAHTIETKQILYIKFQLSNVGRGAAIDLRMSFTRKGKEEKYVSESLTIMPNEISIVGLYFNDSLPLELDTGFSYILNYRNIYGDVYQQKCNIKIKRGDDKPTIYSIDKFLQHKILD
jgi:hypothetical protein